MMNAVARILLGCLLVATFESPIGHSMESFVLRYEVRWCGHFDTPKIQVVEQVVNGRTGATVGAPRTTDYPVPEADAAGTLSPPTDPTWP